MSYLRNLDPRSRRLFQLANAALAAGLLLRLFVHASRPVGQDWLDGLQGLLLGFSIAVNLMTIYKRRRARIGC